MKAGGQVDPLTVQDAIIKVRISPLDKENFRKLIQGRMEDVSRKLMFEISGECEISETVAGGNLGLAILSAPTLNLYEWENPFSRKQQNTFFGICRFIAWCQAGHKPLDEEVYWIAEEMIEQYGPIMNHPVTGEPRKVRPGDPRMKTWQMSLLIQHSLNELAMQDIPKEVMDSIGEDMKKLWAAFYEWRYRQKVDPLLEYELKLSWEEYKELHPVCEFTGMAIPCERIHIVSGGSDIASYEEPWNWIHGSTQVHREIQHQNGWEKVLRLYPHMIGKVERARVMAKKKGLEVTYD